MNITYSDKQTLLSTLVAIKHQCEQNIKDVQQTLAVVEQTISVLQQLTDDDRNQCWMSRITPTSIY